MPKKPVKKAFRRPKKKSTQRTVLNQEENDSSNGDASVSVNQGGLGVNEPLPQAEVLLENTDDTPSPGLNQEVNTVETPSPGLNQEVNTVETPSPGLNQEICKKSLSHLKEKLPHLWKILEDESDMLTLLKFSSETYYVLQRTLHFDREFNLTASFHGKKLFPGHAFYQDVEKLDLRSNLTKDLVTDVCKVLACYRQYEPCLGIPDPQFSSLWSKDEACVRDLNDYEETRYTDTWRSKHCHYAVPQKQFKCVECAKIRKKLSKRLSNKISNFSPSGRLKTSSRFKSFKNLNTPEKRARIKRFTKDIRNLKLANERLKGKIEVLQNILQSEGLNVDEDFSENLSNCLEEANQKNQLTDFHKLFLQQQMKAAQVKGATGMRWHPLMICFALQLKMSSSVAYATMAQSGFLKLPGLRTLFDYTSAMSVREGLHFSIIEDVSKAVEGMEHEYQRFHVLAFDEVAICQGLAQKKSTGEVVGYCSLNKVQEQMVNLEKHVVEVAQEMTPQPLECPPLVKKVLSFMVKGTASNVQSVVASYGVSLLSKEDLHSYTWEVIEILEMSGIQVICIVCDGSPINRGFIHMQPPYSQDSVVVYDTVNIYAPDRLIYFISDPPHLIKTVRNCLYNSGKKKCRKMMKNNQEMCWSTIVALFKLKSSQTVKKLHKLTAPCVYLNSYSRMKVAFAVRVISNSVSEVLADLKWPGTSELCVFV